MEYIGVQTMLVCFSSKGRTVSDTVDKSHEKNLIEDRIINTVNFLGLYTTLYGKYFRQKCCFDIRNLLLCRTVPNVHFSIQVA